MAKGSAVHFENLYFRFDVNGRTSILNFSQSCLDGLSRGLVSELKSAF